MKHIRKRLTYANVMSSIAVFMVLGGATAFAATKIGANQIKANSIKTGKIVKEAVTAGKIKNGAVISAKLGAAAVTSSALADNAVTNTKIADNAVTNGKIADNAVSTGKIADKAVTAAKINAAGLTVPNATNAANAANAAALGGKAASEYSVRYFARVNGTTANPTLAAGSPGVTVNSNRPFTGAATVNFPVNMENCAVVAMGVSGGAEIATRESTTGSGNSVVIVTTTVADPTVNTNFSFNVVGIC